MKVVFVTNPHDFKGQQKIQEAIRVLREQGFAGEISLVDFMQVRDCLPISTAPCMLLQFDTVDAERVFKNVSV